MRMVMSCITMDAVMYGATPIIMIERFEKPPPEKMLRIPRNWLLAKKASSCAALIPGIGIAARKRKTTSAANTKRMRVRKVSSSKTSFTLQRNDPNMLEILGGRSELRSSYTQHLSRQECCY